MSSDATNDITMTLTARRPHDPAKRISHQNNLDPSTWWGSNIASRAREQIKSTLAKKLEQKQTLLSTIIALLTGLEKYANGDEELFDSMAAMYCELRMGCQQGIINYWSAGGMYDPSLDMSEDPLLAIVKSFDGDTLQLIELAHRMHAALDAANWCSIQHKALDLSAFQKYVDLQKIIINRPAFA